MRIEDLSENLDFVVQDIQARCRARTFAAFRIDAPEMKIALDIMSVLTAIGADAHLDEHRLRVSVIVPTPTVAYAVAVCIELGGAYVRSPRELWS